MVRLAVILWFGCLGCSVFGQAAVDRVALFSADFDRPEAIADWKWNKRNADAGLLPAPKGSKGPKGSVLQFKTKRATLLYQRTNVLKSMREAQTVEFWCRAPEGTADTPQVFELQFGDQLGQVHYWRKISLMNGEWRHVVLPLEKLRWRSGVVPDWQAVSRFMIRPRGSGVLQIDGIRIWKGSEKAAAERSIEELREEAFGKKEIRERKESGIHVLTNAETLDLDALAGELKWLVQELHQVFPDLAKPRSAVPLLIFDTQSEFQKFVVAFNRRRGASATAPTAGGFAFEGIATSWSKGKMPRPVFLHEACHVYLTWAAGLPNRQDWVQEGIACYFQQKRRYGDKWWITPAKLKDKPTLAAFSSAKRVSNDDYIFAASLVRWFVEDDKRRDQFWNAIGDMRDNRITKLKPFAKSKFGMTVDELDAAWTSAARKRTARK